MPLRIHLSLLSVLLLNNCSNKKESIPALINEAIVFETKLPKKIDETSGLEYFNGDLITHNDSGGDAKLYLFSETGELLEEFAVDDAENNDWEDITMDDNYLYISDSGNNYGNRKNLNIVITDHLNGFKKVGEINFSYALQEDFKSRNKHPYDAEALISVDDQLVLFSKNREELTTELFLIPKQAGDYELTSVRSFDAKALITGGDYNEALKMVALVGYDRARNQYLFTLQNFNLNSLEQVEMIRLELPLKGKQIEAIKIIDTNTFWITSEDEDGGYPMLYKVKG